MGLAIATASFECAIDGGLAHIVLSQPDRGNPIDGDFCREFSLCMAELSERDDVRSVLISARGRLFSVGGDLAALASRGGAARDDQIVDGGSPYRNRANGPHACARRCGGARQCSGGSVSLMAAADLVVIGKSARISSALRRSAYARQWFHNNRRGGSGPLVPSGFSCWRRR
jgi:2-(1,2-epoxy-1,2-dihydrophenyl)acetyl-CoA isomerase